MPAQTSINVGEDLPTFNPISKIGNLASYSDDSAISIAVEPLLTISNVRPSKTSKLYKVRAKMVLPVSAVDANDVPTGVKAREASVDVTFLFHETATDAEKLNLLTCFEGLLANADVVSVITEGKSIY